MQSKERNRLSIAWRINTMRSSRMNRTRPTLSRCADFLSFTILLLDYFFFIMLLFFHLFLYNVHLSQCHFLLNITYLLAYLNFTVHKKMTKDHAEGVTFMAFRSSSASRSAGDLHNDVIVWLKLPLSSDFSSAIKSFTISAHTMLSANHL